VRLASGRCDGERKKRGSNLAGGFKAGRLLEVNRTAARCSGRNEKLSILDAKKKEMLQSGKLKDRVGGLQGRLQSKDLGTCKAGHSEKGYESRG